MTKQKQSNRYVAKCKQANNIESDEDLEEYIEACIDGGYAPLTDEGCTKHAEQADPRRDYMRKHTKLLVNSVKSKNSKLFAKESDPAEKI